MIREITTRLIITPNSQNMKLSHLLSTVQALLLEFKPDNRGDQLWPSIQSITSKGKIRMGVSVSGEDLINFIS